MTTAQARRPVSTLRIATRHPLSHEAEVAWRGGDGRCRWRWCRGCGGCGCSAGGSPVAVAVAAEDGQARLSLGRAVARPGVPLSPSEATNPVKRLLFLVVWVVGLRAGLTSIGSSPADPTRQI